MGSFVTVDVPIGMNVDVGGMGVSVGEGEGVALGEFTGRLHAAGMDVINIMPMINWNNFFRSMMNSILCKNRTRLPDEGLCRNGLTLDNGHRVKLREEAGEP